MDIKRKLKGYIRKSGLMVYDAFEFVLGKKPPLAPPRHMIFIGGGDYLEIGEEFFEYFLKFGGLKPHQKVLDVGCGLGRMAVPLTRFLDQNGKYDGFDIVPKGIVWCQKNITTKHPNFHFHLADVYSDCYHPKGVQPASRYVFPFKEDEFDFVFLTSVFTHMLPEDLENYLSQIARVLKPGGRCLITFFLLNEESRRHINQGQSNLTFSHKKGVYAVEDQHLPEDAIAYHEDFVLNLYNKYGLKLRGQPHYGSWCGRKEHLSFQDLIVAEKVK